MNNKGPLNKLILQDKETERKDSQQPERRQEEQIPSQTIQILGAKVPVDYPMPLPYMLYPFACYNYLTMEIGVLYDLRTHVIRWVLITTIH